MRKQVTTVGPGTLLCILMNPDLVLVAQGSGHTHHSQLQWPLSGKSAGEKNDVNAQGRLFSGKSSSSCKLWAILCASAKFEGVGKKDNLFFFFFRRREMYSEASDSVFLWTCYSRLLAFAHMSQTEKKKWYMARSRFVNEKAKRDLTLFSQQWDVAARTICYRCRLALSRELCIVNSNASNKTGLQDCNYKLSLGTIFGSLCSSARWWLESPMQEIYKT